MNEETYSNNSPSKVFFSVVLDFKVFIHDYGGEGTLFKFYVKKGERIFNSLFKKLIRLYFEFVKELELNSL